MLTTDETKMREIKFKAWLEDLQIIVTVHKIDFLGDGNYKIYFKNLQNGKYVDCALSPSSMVSRNTAKGHHFKLMQYTGLKDKNDVEVYEGYIAKKDNGAVGEVVYFKPTVGHKLYNDNYGQVFDLFETDKKYLEVVGNIYENPEILKDTK